MVQAIRIEYWDATGQPTVAIFGSFATNGRDLAFQACKRALYRARPGLNTFAEADIKDVTSEAAALSSLQPPRDDVRITEGDKVRMATIAGALQL